MFDKEYVFRGKHADMVKRLTGSLGSNIKKSFFETNYDVYLIAPLVGYLYQRRAKVEKGEDNTTKIFADKMMNEKDNTVYNYRILMLMQNKDKPQDELTRIVFKLDNDDEARKQYDELFNEYVLGGVEVLYEKIFGEDSELEDYLMNMYNFLDEFNNRYFAEIEI